ncbi:hypothetical protein NCAS_0B01240 [Naumovozyma castellii]|uniref:Uncharacterized protein n=1 Tax=Naumovozyma castellii TaxID=27288 RepID=G0VB84_NAUCA|nr:hypothetical protein NCAS_0B01240 [Naumovozyma castellii CBS 4309]CCC68208.1 hypothetical protein NCAS_0B01240 [Naumovozyma castellii CBS 4309]
MDYEEILFGLQPLINASTVKEIPLQEVYVESYLTVLDQLAVHLRSPMNRDVVGSTGLLSNLLRVLESMLDICFHDSTFAGTNSLFKLSSELIRCIANCLVDNDSNREIFVGKGSDLQSRNKILDYFVGRILKMEDSFDDQFLSDLQLRTIIMVKNLCLDNVEYAKRFAPHIRGPLLDMLQRNQNVYLEDSMAVLSASDLLSEFVQVYYSGISLSDLTFLAQFIARVSKTVVSLEIDKDSNEADNDDSELEDDPNSDILFNLTQSFETIVEEDSKLNFSEDTLSLQGKLFESLEILAPKNLANKLIIMRRLVSSIGHISANETNTNQEEQQLCQNVIQSSKNGYTIAAALILLSNSIHSRKDADSILQRIELRQFLLTAKYFQDPIQYQGFFHILKKLLSISNAMFLTDEDLKNICEALNHAHNQTKFFQNLSPLIEGFLTKLIAVLPSSVVFKLVCNEEENLFLPVILEADSIIACLTLGKLLLAKQGCPDSIQERLWNKVFKFQDSTAGDGVSMHYLFELTKTLGIFFKNWGETRGIGSNVILGTYVSDMTLLVETVVGIKGKGDRASESVLNNGRFVAGMILKLLGKEEALTPEETKLQLVCKQLFE